MNFDFSEEQKLLQKTARDYLEDQSPLSVARAVMESDATHSEELWKGVAEMGWLGAAIPESYGGAGFGHLELALLAQEVGRSLAPIPFSSSVYLASEAIQTLGSDEQKQRWLPRLAAGELIGTLALSEGPGETAESGIAVRFADGKLTGSKSPVCDGDIAGLLVTVARTDAGTALVVAEGDSEIERTAIASIDPTRTLARVEFDGAAAELLGTDGQGWTQLQGVLDRAAVLLAFEQIGTAERSFEITKEYTLGRYAFGRPIASFQAIKHRLADLYTAIELAKSNAYYGAWALENGSDELATAACSARISATDALDLAATEMIQMHGGVGFTWEYDCHMFYRRSKLQGLAIGSASEWREKLIARLQAAA
jgi:alkylation response protein AidB-like acyl-CoA dehydrogenase